MAYRISEAGADPEYREEGRGGGGGGGGGGALMKM